jgi:hypothetical protein
MNAPASRRVPSRRELVYRLSVATGLSAPQVNATLDGVHIGLGAYQRCVVAAERIGVELPDAPRRPARVVERLAADRAAAAASRPAPEAEAPRPPRATDATPRVPSLPGRGGRGRGSDARSREALSRRHALNNNRDTAPPRGPQEAA